MALQLEPLHGAQLLIERKREQGQRISAHVLSVDRTHANKDGRLARLLENDKKAPLKASRGPPQPTCAAAAHLTPSPGPLASNTEHNHGEPSTLL